MRSGRSATFVALGLLGWLLIAGPALAPGQQLADRDTARLYYPVKLDFAEGLHHGELRFWAAYAEGGVSLLGQVTPAVLHPFTLLYALPFDFAFALDHVLALLLAGAGAFLLARVLGADDWAALIAAFAYGGCGPLVSAASSNHPYALGPAHVPLALAALHWFRAERTGARLLAAGAALALTAYAGDPQSFVVCAIIGLAWCRAAAVPWIAAGALLCAPVALPGAVQLSRSARAEGLTAEERAAFPLPLLRLPGLAVPAAFEGREPEPGARSDTYAELLATRGSTPLFESILFGAPALLLAAATRRRGLLAGAAAFAVLAVLGGVSLGIFRFPEKLLAPAALLVALAAAFPDAGRARRAGLLFAGVCTAALLAFLLGAGPLRAALQAGGRTHDAGLAAQFVALLQVGLVETAALSAATALLAPRAPLLPFVTLLSLALHAPLHTVPVERYRAPSSTAAVLEPGTRVWVDASGPLLVPALPGSAQAARLLGAREALWPQLQRLDGLQGVAPYFSAPDAHFLRALRDQPEKTLDLLGVGAIVSRDGSGAQSESGYRVRRRAPWPAAFLASADLSPLRAAVASRPGAGAIDVRADGPGLLVVGEHFDPGWRARVDGAPAEVREELVALGVTLAPGAHRVELRFWPAGLNPGLACCAACAAALFALRRRRLA